MGPSPPPSPRTANCLTLCQKGTKARPIATGLGKTMTAEDKTLLAG